MANAQPYKLAGWQATTEKTIVSVGSVVVGGPVVTLIAGAFAGTGHADVRGVARLLSQLGIDILAGDGYRADDVTDAAYRLVPTEIDLLHDARERFGVSIMLEATSLARFEQIEAAADIMLVASRNMHNFSLLQRVGQSRKPVVLQRGSAATLEEFVFAAEYILAEGNPHVILCERGIRTFTDHAPYTLDLAVVPALRQQSHLPIIVDPSYSASSPAGLYALACAAIAVGADGLMLGVQPTSDQQHASTIPGLSPELLSQLADDVRQIARIIQQHAR